MSSDKSATKLTITTGMAALAMANEMFGEGVKVVSAKYSGDKSSAGIYNDGLHDASGVAPSNSGVILSTGHASDFTNSSGPANQDPDTTSQVNGVNGDKGLNGIAGTATYDAAILEAEFIPTGNVLSMQLVFSSEEYLEWVSKGFNDAVGIWVNGKLAKMTVGDGEISIDNINNTSNQNLFRDNTKSIYNTEMDGLTVVVNVKAEVNIGEINTIRIGIADAGDRAYDSNLLIVGDSLQTVLIAHDDIGAVAAKSIQVIDLLANDTFPDGSKMRVSQINGQDMAVGETLTLTTGEKLTLNADYTLTVVATATMAGTANTLSYTIIDQNGTTDTAFVTIVISPVDGTDGNDQMTGPYADKDGQTIGGADGQDDVILGYDGNDKIFAGGGNDDIFGGTGNDFIRAEAGDDLIDGGTGNDVLDGGTGTDTMRGGDGNDIYYIDALGNSVSEAAGSGHDKVISALSHVLDATFEDLWLIEGSAATVATGNAVANILVGNANANLIAGLGGDDRIFGGAGADTLSGGDGTDHLDGSTGDDMLSGGAGNDSILGGTGADILDGGAGNDDLRGNSGADRITGGDGNDRIIGGKDADTMEGGAGDDVYFVEDAGDIVTEAAANGYDIVRSSVSFALSDGLERLDLRGVGNIDGFGNAGSNAIFGTAGRNALSGGAGNDRLSGLGGDDAADGGEGADMVIGGAGNDVLAGGTGNDLLLGGVGDDVLEGGTGSDHLAGGVGADLFVFRQGDGYDVLQGFEQGIDKIALIGADINALFFAELGNDQTVFYGDGDAVTLTFGASLHLTEADFIFL